MASHKKRKRDTDPRLEVFDLDALPTVEFSQPIFVLLENDAVHLDDAFVVNEVEQRLVGDGTLDGFVGDGH